MFISVGENVLTTELANRLSRLAGTTINAKGVFSSGATTVLEQLPQGLRHAGLMEYNDSTRAVLQIGLILTCLCVPGAAALAWKRVSKDKFGKKEDDSITEKGSEDAAVETTTEQTKQDVS